jgi:putative flippase GtrA
MFRGWLKYASISVPLDTLAFGLAVLLRESALSGYYYGYLGAEAIGIFIIFLIRYLVVSKYIWRVHSAVS